jgi:hypothetical protein
MKDPTVAQPTTVADDIVEINSNTREITITAVTSPLTELTSNELNTGATTSIVSSAAREGASFASVRTSHCQTADLAQIFVTRLPESFEKCEKLRSVHSISYRRFLTAWTRAMCAETGGFSRLTRESADGQNVR